MEDASTGKFTARRIAAAMFTEPTNLHDAVSDLREGGLGDLAITFSTEATLTQEDGSLHFPHRKIEQMPDGRRSCSPARD